MLLGFARGADENGCWAAVARLPCAPPRAAEPCIGDGRPAPTEAFVAEPTAEPDIIRAAAMVGAACAAAAGPATAPARPATPAMPGPAPNDPTGGCSPAERRPTCDALSRAEVAVVPDPAVEPAADARGVVAGSRNHPAGATGSAGIHAALSVFGECVRVGVGACIGACRGAWRGGVAADVRSTGSACAAGLRVFTAPARQPAPAPRAAASLAAAAPAAAAPRPFAGGRQTVGRA